MKLSDKSMKDFLRLKTASKCSKANKNKVRLKRLQKSKTRSIRFQQQQQRSRTFSINEFDESISNLTPVDNFASCQLKDNENVHYVIVNNLEQGYNFETNLCFKVRMVNLTSNWQIQLDGYRCSPDETVNISTCFGYNSSIRFIPSISSNEESKKRDENVEFVKQELKEQYKDFIDGHRDSLFDGKAVLLRIEIDSVALNKYKLVLHYITKSMTDRKMCKNILAYLRQDLSTTSLIKDGTKYSSLDAKMDKIYDSIEISSSDIVLVCGSSNCGKSSLVHHLINRYVSRNSSSLSPNQCPAYYLECDPGQTEFAPCGILSLVKVEPHQMIQNVPGKFMFDQKDFFSLTDLSTGRIISKILGTTTPSFYATRYLDIVGQLLHHYLSLNNTSAGPLFINTMGWIEDVGLDLLLQIIHITNPSLVIRIHNNDDDFPPPIHPIQEFKDRSMRKYLNAFNDVCSVNNLRNRLFNFKFYYASSCALYQYSPFKSSSLRREINQLSYLTSGLFPKISYLPFYALEPVKFSLSNRYVHILSSPKMAPYLIYDLLNVSWIILGNIPITSDPVEEKTSDSDQSPTTPPSNLKLLSHLPNSAVCLGCGIVRNVNPKQNCIYVTLPHSIASNQINLIVVPNLIPIPTGLLSEQFLYLPSTMLPYLFSH